MKLLVVTDGRSSADKIGANARRHIIPIG